MGWKVRISAWSAGDTGTKEVTLLGSRKEQSPDKLRGEKEEGERVAEQSNREVKDLREGSHILF